ncbi:hypothetical protein Wcon_02010 [Wolbachia endosymbiont of Cylisticus convexus]|uniref:hypothetical protein n=1 Tax=Wolbachia endosymbiont of Cylisticus convexus TaxID=118728 RepID=UPI000DF718B9|nr:hypothetical protein [Wolbachia endosymbiont of Cylisticus convexus]RDD33960.1 hypothetical protein Wcon_02010 [Wolbachia endosymbiont of Cylisticus convexus]
MNSILVGNSKVRGEAVGKVLNTVTRWLPTLRMHGFGGRVIAIKLNSGGFKTMTSTKHSSHSVQHSKSSGNRRSISAPG